MGSNPSKNEVVKIRIPSSKGKRDESDDSLSSKPNITSKAEVDELNGELNALKVELKTQKEQNANSEDLSYSLQNQLDEREREILLLREELDSLQRKTSISTRSDKDIECDNTGVEDKCDRTIYAKDQYIQTLEEELKMMKELTTKQDERYQRKLKKLRSLLSKSKQDSSLKLFELKDEKSKLVEENTKLQERIERMSLDSGDFGRQGSASSQRSVLSRDKDINENVTEDVIDNHDDPRMKLILELSEQVANLDSENLALKRELKHCRKVAERVEKLRIQKKQNKSSDRTEIVCVDKGSSSWKEPQSNQACLEIT
ncbi:kinectin-like [Actinia tenebrosa]|uniref:Kinectin-like n=1 Tax=Actinia tenebrosa TaxID=6105 RepID=A0A6P8IIB8_ACTTE|nr:kinectin-like [Actinia tenebrosa]